MRHPDTAFKVPSIEDIRRETLRVPPAENLSEDAKALRTYDTNRNGALDPQELEEYVREATIVVFSKLKEGNFCADTVEKRRQFPKRLEQEIRVALQDVFQSGITSDDAIAAFPNGITTITPKIMQDVASPIIMREINACIPAKPKVSR
jgi:hypothetical protein